MIRNPDRCDCLEAMLPGSYCIKSQCPFRKRRKEGPRTPPQDQPKNEQAE